MGQRPMSTFPGSIPCAVGRACLGRTELVSRGAVCLAAASGWVHVADAASRALASMPLRPSLALDKRSSAASAHVLACEVVGASDAAACPARSMSGEAGERSEPNLFIGHIPTQRGKRAFSVLVVWVWGDGRVCWPWRLWQRPYWHGVPHLEVFYPGDCWIDV